MIALLLALGLTAALCACGSSENASGSAASEPASAGSSLSSPSGGSSAAAADTAAGADQSTETGLLPTFPSSVKTEPSETKSNQEIEELIVQQYDIPKEDRASTRYFYNYADLNGDGTDEVIVAVMGPYTSGTGGDSGLILAQIDGKLVVNQALTLIRMPIIVSDQVTKGCRELICQSSGGGAESGYVRLVCSDGSYTRVSDGTPLDSLDGVSGTAILYTDAAAADAPVLTLG